LTFLNSESSIPVDRLSEEQFPNSERNTP